MLFLASLPNFSSAIHANEDSLGNHNKNAFYLLGPFTYFFDQYPMQFSALDNTSTMLARFGYEYDRMISKRLSISIAYVGSDYSYYKKYPIRENYVDERIYHLFILSGSFRKKILFSKSLSLAGIQTFDLGYRRGKERLVLGQKQNSTRYYASLNRFNSWGLGTRTKVHLEFKNRIALGVSCAYYYFNEKDDLKPQYTFDGYVPSRHMLILSPYIGVLF